MQKYLKNGKNITALNRRMETIEWECPDVSEKIVFWKQCTDQTCFIAWRYTETILK